MSAAENKAVFRSNGAAFKIMIDPIAQT